MRFVIRVSPKASRSEIIEKNGVLKAYLNSPPEDGKANKELIELVAKRYGVSKSSVAVVRGHTSRTKTLEVIGI
jgi:uncharacterized protein (TIGR00251 family)